METFQQKNNIDYKHTLNLPNTAFPMKGDGAKREPEIQKYWFENKIYEKALEQRKKQMAERFLLHDGPPYLSSGNIHIGTALNKILKDIIVKYKTLKGYYSPYLPGFDCHGLPIEAAVYKDRKKTDGNLSPLQIRRECIEFVFKNRKLQEEKFKRLGVLGDWERSYMTIDKKFEAKQLALFANMVDKEYIYRGLKPVYWCSVCQTALAEAEIEYVENYSSPSIYVAFNVVKLSSLAKFLDKFSNLRIVIWTTTPWTIPGNLAVCLNKDFEYVVVNSKRYGNLVLAKDLLSAFNSKIDENCEILATVKGLELEHTIYKHPIYERESPVILGEHVTLETGTGCVHTAPGHGLEDFVVGHKYRLPILSPVNEKGCLTIEAGSELVGLNVHKNGNQKVIELLESKGALIFYENYLHSYPHCWRSRSPVIFRATEQWFCSVEKFRSLALKEIDLVTWIPSSGRNRIFSMVESRTDWCISRQRIWGVPIPAFYCKGCNKTHLNKRLIDYILPMIENYGTDVWLEKSESDLLPKDYKCECGNNTFRKETDTMDVWFDSGSTHFAVVDQEKFLFNKNQVSTPVEMYLEGSDQHRGWFQSSLLTSVAIKNKAPYKTVLTHGFVLDENGRKMSKSLGNVVDPEKVINEYGADLLRLWVASVDYSSDMKIGLNMLKQLAEVYRNIRNTSRFILSNLFDFTESDIVPHGGLWNIDKYILHRQEEVKEEIASAFENYEFYKYYQILQNYCAVDLSSFYFDLNKDRLYTSGKKSSSRRAAQTVLSQIIFFLIPVLCPVLPHLAEDIWRYLPESLLKNVESPICLDWPETFNEYKDYNISANFAKILQLKDIVYLALEKLRAQKKIGKSLEAKVLIYVNDKSWLSLLNEYKNELETIFIVSCVEIFDHEILLDKLLGVEQELGTELKVVVTLAGGEKCSRCWKQSMDVSSNSLYPGICNKCVLAIENKD